MVQIHQVSICQRYLSQLKAILADFFLTSFNSRAPLFHFIKRYVFKPFSIGSILLIVILRITIRPYIEQYVPSVVAYSIGALCGVA